MNELPFDFFDDSYPSQYEKEMKDKVRNLEIEEKKKRKKTVSNREEFLLVDGYNIIFAWEELNELAKSLELINDNKTKKNGKK